MQVVFRSSTEDRYSLKKGKCLCSVTVNLVVSFPECKVGGCWFEASGICSWKLFFCPSSSCPLEMGTWFFFSFRESQSVRNEVLNSTFHMSWPIVKSLMLLWAVGCRGFFNIFLGVFFFFHSEVWKFCTDVSLLALILSKAHTHTQNITSYSKI